MRKAACEALAARSHLTEIHTELAARLSLPGVDADMLADAERAHERAVLSPRQGVLAALAHAQLTPLTAFSDMYLSGDDMRQVLPDEVQQRISRWWISCETGLRKDATGSWKQLAQREGCDDGLWLHIGDNEHADVQMPQLAGLLTPVHVLRPSALLDVVPGLRPLRHPSGAQAPWPEQLWRGLLANGFATSPTPHHNACSAVPSSMGACSAMPYSDRSCWISCCMPSASPTLMTLTTCCS